jgi:hypothetical protein
VVSKYHVRIAKCAASIQDLRQIDCSTFNVAFFNDLASFIEMLVEQPLKFQGIRARECVPKCRSLFRVMLVIFGAKYSLADSKLMGSHCPLVEWPKRHKLVEVLEIVYVNFVGSDTDNWT